MALPSWLFVGLLALAEVATLLYIVRHYRSDTGGRWSRTWLAVALVTNLAMVAYMVYGYFRGRAGDVGYAAVYNLVREPTWLNFKLWWAHMVNDPWTEVLLVFVFLLMPLPFLPYHVHERMELLMAKLGLYMLLSSAILGAPNYDPTAAFAGEGKLRYILGWALLGLIAALSITSAVCMRGGILCLPGMR